MLVYEALKEAIVSGRIKPGEWLPVQRELEDQLGVSRPPIRESAVTKLQAEGLLTGGQGNGLQVADMFEDAFASPLSNLLISNPQVRRWISWNFAVCWRGPPRSMPPSAVRHRASAFASALSGTGVGLYARNAAGGRRGRMQSSIWADY